MRNGSEEGIWYNGRFCRVGSSFYRTDTSAFYRGGLPDMARTVKCDDSLAVVVEEETEHEERIDI
jgi:hypothetical protein